MDPDSDGNGGMARVEGFVQRQPRDGIPPSRRTVVHFGYDRENLYAVFQAFDDPLMVRGNLTRRDDAYDDFNDDQVVLWLDTFDDRRRAYYLSVNPAGVQYDALYSESDNFPGDKTFDMVWRSSHLRTGKGYVVLFSIPFRSLRFPDAAQQKWGILLERWVGRDAEWSFWPRVALDVEGFLSQTAELSGLENVSPGRNIQVVPYATFRASRQLDAAEAVDPGFVTEPGDPDLGLDAKVVIRDKLVLDLTANPEFSQVESDSPQVTVNQRFEVLFPEKRPFFLENADYFSTPINLLFTRRIADPRVGARLTGKMGPYAMGTLLVDDESPGRMRPPDDPLEGKRAGFGIFRLSRDILDQSTIGMIYTGREFEDSSNQVGGVDGRFRLNRNWTTQFQAVSSRTRQMDGTELSGPGYGLSVDRSGENFVYELDYNDFGPGFRTEAGFVNRVDIRQATQNVRYFFRPEGKRLVWLSTGVYVERVLDHDDLRLDRFVRPWVRAQFTRQTAVSGFYKDGQERLRPQDVSAPAVLPGERNYRTDLRGVGFETRPLNVFSASGEFSWGTAINFVPAAGSEPFLAEATNTSLTFIVRPPGRMRIETSFLGTRLSDRRSGAEIFTDRIARTRWNWQFSRELSLRTILQYNATRANPALTSLERVRSLNADLLLAYQVNPWTALYVGINGNAQNLELVDAPGGHQIVRTPNDMLNDSRQVFIKYSYLIRG